MDAVARVLENYTHRALPNLGSSSRNEPHAPIHVHRTLTLPSFSHSTSSSPDEDGHSHAEDVQNAVKKTVLEAYAALVQQYIDSQDLLVHVLPHSLIRFRDGDDVVTNDEEVEYPTGATDDLKALLGLGDTQGGILFPVEFGWGHSGTEWTENVLQLLANLSPQEDELVIELHSDAALISPASASLFVDQLVHLIASSSSSSDTAQLSTPDDNLLSISPFAKRYDPALAHPVTEYLLRTAATHPEWPAHEIYASGDLWDEENQEGGGKEVITYGELNGRSNSVARWLIARLGLVGGEGKEERICVCSQRDAWFYVLQAAIWKAGCCYVSVSTLSSAVNVVRRVGLERYM